MSFNSVDSQTSQLSMGNLGALGSMGNAATFSEHSNARVSNLLLRNSASVSEGLNNMTSSGHGSMDDPSAYHRSGGEKPPPLEAAIATRKKHRSKMKPSSWHGPMLTARDRAVRRGQASWQGESTVMQY